MVLLNVQRFELAAPRGKRLRGWLENAPACLFMGSDLDKPKSASFMTPVEYTSESRSCKVAWDCQNYAGDILDDRSADAEA